MYVEQSNGSDKRHDTENRGGPHLQEQKQEKRLITNGQNTWDMPLGVPLSTGTTKCLNRQYRPNRTRCISSCKHV